MIDVERCRLRWVDDKVAWNGDPQVPKRCDPGSGPDCLVPVHDLYWTR